MLRLALLACIGSAISCFFHFAPTEMEKQQRSMLESPSADLSSALSRINHTTAAASKDSHADYEMWHRRVFWPAGAVYTNSTARRHKEGQVLSAREG